MKYFSLASGIYAAECDNAIIILDADRDNYISLIDDSVRYLKYIITNPFTQNEHGEFVFVVDSVDYDILTCRSMIQEFLSHKIITTINSPSTKKIAAPAKIDGGLCEYQWDTKRNWVTRDKTTLFQSIKAFISLIKVNRAIKKNGMKGLFDLIKRRSSTTHITHPSQELITSVSAAVDAATKMYPKKTYCLGWAATFVIEARKRGIACYLKVGVQTNPFYAHAWAELADGTIINDDPQVGQVLSIIATIPEV